MSPPNHLPSIVPVKINLSEIGGKILGAAWWGTARLWGVVMGAMLLLAPLLLGNMAAELVDALPATAALAVGVVGAYALGLPPWDGEDRTEFMLLIGGTTVSVVAWDLMRGTADMAALLVALGLTVIGWPIRRAFPTD